LAEVFDGSIAQGGFLDRLGHSNAQSNHLARDLSLYKFFGRKFTYSKLQPLVAEMSWVLSLLVIEKHKNFSENSIYYSIF